MAITDIQISEELETNAPSIKYRGNEGPKSPEEMKMAGSDRYFQILEIMINELEGELGRELTDEEYEAVGKKAYDALGDQSRGPILPSPEDPVNPFGPKPIGPPLPDRQMAADGGIMEIKQIGKPGGIVEPGITKYGILDFLVKAKDKIVDDLIPNEIKENPLLTAAAIAGGDYLINDREYLDGILKGTTEFITGGDDKPNVIKRILDKETGDNRTVGGDILGSIGRNIVPIVGGIGAGLFTRNTESNTPGLPDDNTALNLADYKKAANLLNQKQGLAANMNFLPTVESRKYKPEDMAITYAQAVANGGRIGYNLGGRIGMAEGGIMDLGGMEKDYRAEGGFVPIGREEKADDVPARLSVNEFVFTADAVRNAGGGDIDQGAKVMENMMKHLEAGGQVSEESQGMAGARDMFEVSERLSEVV